LLFAAPEPLTLNVLSEHLDEGDDVKLLLEELQTLYATRGVNLVVVNAKWAFRTAPDLGYLLERYSVEQRKLSKAALETLAIIAYHQPVTRGEIEEIRGVAISKGTLDVLIESEWVRLRGRRRAPGRPITYGTTDQFLDQFGIESVRDLPGLKELKSAGLLSGNLPPDFEAPDPRDVAELMADEDPLDEDDEMLDGEDNLVSEDGEDLEGFDEAETDIDENLNDNEEAGDVDVDLDEQKEDQENDDRRK